MDELEYSERAPMMASQAKKESQKPDWSKFGLSSEQQKEADSDVRPEEESYAHHEEGETNELFTEDQSARGRPWWKANFFISEPVLFGTWDGVFTSSMINIFGVVIFLRTGWMVGNAGIGFSVLIILMTIMVALIAAMSAIGVCERCQMESGGVYFLLSHILGARLGAAVGILYCFGQAVACSLYTVGFGESIASLFDQDNEWIARGIACGVLLFLLGINVAGVKWVIRLQLILLMVLFIAVLDFLVGSFVHTDLENGFVGYQLNVLQNNTGPDYQPGESFFTVFGVFFPTATGVFAGINMSGDLRHPNKNIPVGTLSAVGVSTFLYLIFALVLGSTCLRDYLQNDYMIAEKVSIVGVLFLAGLYISSVSSCMGGLYGSPRILQCIANTSVIPFMKVLGKGVSVFHLPLLAGVYICALTSTLSSLPEGVPIILAIAKHKVLPLCLTIERGPNKVPVYALIVVTLIALIFIFIGNVNTLGPIVTMPFMLTYAFVDYAYFALAMSFDKQSARDARFQGTQPSTALPSTGSSNDPQHTSVQNGGHGYGTIEKKGNDLDSLFPERMESRGQLQRQDSLGSPTFYAEGGDGKDPKSETTSYASEVEDTAGLLKKGPQPPPPSGTHITRQPRSFYSIFCNRWLSLFGGLASLVIMFAIQWGYALANISVLIIVYIYIGQVNPGVFPGIAEFRMWEWIRDGFKNCCRRGPPPPEQIVVTPNTPAMNTMAAQLTEDNEDFKERGRYHQSEVVKGENFDDYHDSD